MNSRTFRSPLQPPPRQMRRSRPGPSALAVSQDRLEEKTFVSAPRHSRRTLRRHRQPEGLRQGHRDCGRQGHPEDAPAGIRWQGPGAHLQGPRARSGIREHRRSSGRARGLRRLRVRGFGARSCAAVDGATHFYDVPLNTHKNGILDTSTVPSPLPVEHAVEARRIAGAIAEALGYVGLSGSRDVLSRTGRRHAADGQRDGAAGSQLRSLDHGRLSHLSVREPHRAPSPAGRSARPSAIRMSSRST